MITLECCGLKGIREIRNVLNFVNDSTPKKRFIKNQSVIDSSVFLQSVYGWSVHRIRLNKTTRKQ